MKPGGRGDAERRCGHSFSATVEVGGRFARAHGDSVVVLLAGTAANLVCFKWLGNHISLPRKTGGPKVNTYLAMARFRFGDSRIGDVRYASDIKVGTPGSSGAVAAFVLEADVAALLRAGALEALGGQLDSARDALTIRNYGVDILLKVNEMGRYVLSVISPRDGPSCADRGPEWAASYFYRRSWESVPICRAQAYVCPFRGMVCILSNVHSSSRPARLRPRVMPVMKVRLIPGR